MRYLLYSFDGDIFFAHELRNDPDYFCDVWTTGAVNSLDVNHKVYNTPEENDFGFMVWFDSPQLIEDIQQQYPEYLI